MGVILAYAFVNVYVGVCVQVGWLRFVVATLLHVVVNVCIDIYSIYVPAKILC